MLAAVRTESDGERGASWLQLPVPTMARIHEVSGGNPFDALELARAFDAQPPGAEVTLPTTLAEVVRARIGDLEADTHEALLATACLAAPTVDLIACATDTDSADVVGIDGYRVHFAHPFREVGDDVALRIHLSISLSFARASAGDLPAALPNVEHAVTDATPDGTPGPTNSNNRAKVIGNSSSAVAGAGPGNRALTRGNGSSSKATGTGNIARAIGDNKAATAP